MKNDSYIIDGFNNELGHEKMTSTTVLTDISEFAAMK